MITICLHHNDADGRACGAIVRRALNQDVALVEMNYGEPIPWEAIELVNRVIVVDFSLPLADMQRVAAGRELVWIDHHKTALEEMQGAANQWPGIRSVDEAACVLTWLYFFPDIPLPKAVVLIGDRDIWRWAEEHTGAFGEGLYQQDTNAENDELWQPLLDDDDEILNQLIDHGGILRQANLNSIERKVSRFGQEVIFEGHKTLLVNDRGNGDMGDYINKLGYEIGYCYIDILQNGTLNTVVTLYSKDVDVSQIARKFGGGGHPGAAGFAFERSQTPFPLDAELSS